MVFMYPSPIFYVFRFPTNRVLHTQKNPPLPEHHPEQRGDIPSTTYSLLHSDFRSVFKGESDVLFIVYRHIIQQCVPGVLVKFCDGLHLVQFRKEQFSIEAKTNAGTLCSNSNLMLNTMGCMTEQLLAGHDKSETEKSE